MQPPLIKLINPLLDHLPNMIPIILALPFNEDTVDSLRQWADDRPELDLVFCDEGNGRVFQRYVEGVEPAAMVADDDWSFDAAGFGVGAVVFDSDCQVVHPFPVIIEIPDTSFDDLLLDCSLFQPADHKSKEKPTGQKTGQREEPKRQDRERTDNDVPLVPLLEIFTDKALPSHVLDFFVLVRAQFLEGVQVYFDCQERYEDPIHGYDIENHH